MFHLEFWIQSCKFTLVKFCLSVIVSGGLHYTRYLLRDRTASVRLWRGVSPQHPPAVRGERELWLRRPRHALGRQWLGWGPHGGETRLQRELHSLMSCPGERNVWPRWGQTCNTQERTDWHLCLPGVSCDTSGLRAASCASCPLGEEGECDSEDCQVTSGWFFSHCSARPANTSSLQPWVSLVPDLLHIIYCKE